MMYEKQEGVPKFLCREYEGKNKDYVVLIPIINEGDRIVKELQRADKFKIAEIADIVICDGVPGKQGHHHSHQHYHLK